MHILVSGTPPISSLAGKADLRERIRESSKLLLGNRDRAEVGAAIGASEDGLVNATDLALQLGLPNTRVRAQLIAFAEAGYLVRLPPTPPGKNYFKRTETRFWDACAELIERAVGR